eukprot:CAMPEP_0168554246 /NCGR_PEP_ID=MMETSP0413-20121227/7675_1 /TAXON_ID=136452 /ORGANISM="Filamoeba nolandi, Strain NC-AS-23-1" /LENGTH=88 /DNA_ID=CAMNT_0008584969 /DNA_START=963 /DNA_END=1230 /DNA_ORIENTATION=+
MGQQEVGWKFEALVSNEEPDHFGSPKLGKGKKIKKARKSGKSGQAPSGARVELWEGTVYRVEVAKWSATGWEMDEESEKEGNLEGPEV